MENTYKYKATAYWILARRGITSAEDVPQAIEFSSPPEFEGESEMWTPQHFFMAAIASCYVSTFRSLADTKKFDSVSLDVTTEGTLTRTENGYRFSKIVIHPILSVATDEQIEPGRILLEKSLTACPTASSVNCPVTLLPIIQVSAILSA
jgi:organic hydroperoxide reductase OsmC/OhrA